MLIRDTCPVVALGLLIFFVFSWPKTITSYFAIWDPTCRPNQFLALSTNFCAEEFVGVFCWREKACCSGCVLNKSNVHCCDFPLFSFAVKEPGDVSEEDIPTVDCTQYCQLASAPWGSLELVRAAAFICPYHVPSDASLWFFFFLTKTEKVSIIKIR